MPVRKRFGQHFLHDANVVRRMLDAIAPRPGERLVEVGPGRGALTFGLLERAHELTVIEIDRDLAGSLREHPGAGASLHVRIEDVLRTDFVALRGDGAKLRIVGNLPYNISTPLMFHLLAQRDAFEDMYFMLQKEVVDRMAAPPGNKTYGRLTVMLAAYAEVQALFDVGPGAFSPPPKVWSAVVRLIPSTTARFDFGNDTALRSLVSAAFSHRRKTLRNGVKEYLTSEQIQSCGIDASRRPETLSPAEFGALAAYYVAQRAQAQTV